MRLRHIIIFFFFAFSIPCFAQKTDDSAIMDTTIYDFDELFSELDLLLDSLYTPRSFMVVSANLAGAYFQFGESSSATASTEQWHVLSPSLNYFHKSGLGAGASASLINDYDSPNPFQYALTASYDYLKKRQFVTGVSYTRFINSKNVPFYLSPLQNDVYAYFMYRKHWLKPSIAANLGWGSRQSVQQQVETIKKIKGTRGAPAVATTTTTLNESTIDMNLVASLRHDFYFLRVISPKGYLRLTPMLTFTSGTQQFGFNAANTTVTRSPGKSAKSSVISSQDITLNNALSFRPLSLTAQFRSELALNKFFLQPQFLLDYYFPATDNKFTFVYGITAGYIL